MRRERPETVKKENIKRGRGGRKIKKKVSRRGILSVSGGLWCRSRGIARVCDKDSRGGGETRRTTTKQKRKGCRLDKHARPRLALDTARARFDPIVASDHHRPAPDPEVDLVTLWARPWKLAPLSFAKHRRESATRNLRDCRKGRASVRERK